MEAIYAPPGHPVFQLVPDLFDACANQYYDDAGQPVITSKTFWDIYCDILARFNCDGINQEFDTIIQNHTEQQTAAFNNDIPVLANMRPFRPGQMVMGREIRSEYMGGLLSSSSEMTSDMVPDERRFADFTSDEDDDSEDSDPW